MRVENTELEGVLILTPDVFNDGRGHFFESYNRKEFEKYAITVEFVQDNQSLSRRGVLRGLHYQAGDKAQAKLVRVVSGKILDVCVDIRKNSPSFGRWLKIELSSENKKQLFIPRGFAHGFLTMSPEAEVFYKCDNFYSPQASRGIMYDDADLAIDWREDPKNIILSGQDLKNPSFSEAEKF